MKHVHLAAATVIVTLAVPATALAQEANNAWGGRALVTFSVGAQTASPVFQYDFATTLFDQNATAGLAVPGKTGLSFDIGGGVRLLQNLGVGVTYSRYSKERTATLTTTIPNPLNMFLPSEYYAYLPYSTEPSTISRQMPLQREENAVHIQAIYRAAVGGRIQLGAFGGPSYFRCADDHITKFALEGELSPFDWTVAFHDVSQLVDRGSAWGYHGGGSFTYLVTRHVGAGMTVRYSYATHVTTNHFSDTTKLDQEGIWGGDSGTVSVTMKHGGIQWNGGISIHF